MLFYKAGGEVVVGIIFSRIDWFPL